MRRVTPYTRVRDFDVTKIADKKFKIEFDNWDCIQPQLITVRGSSVSIEIWRHNSQVCIGMYLDDNVNIQSENVRRAVRDR